MHILFVTRFFPPDTGGGGIASYTNYIARGLVQKGHHVRIISQLASNSKSYQEINGIQIIRIPADLRSYRWTRLPVLGRHIRLIRDILYAYRVRRSIMQMSTAFKPDIVEYADIDAEGAWHPNICPFVVKLHTSHYILRSFYSPNTIPYSTIGIESLEHKTIQRANGISSPSLFVAKEMARKCCVDERGIHWVQNPIDTDFFSPLARSEEKVGKMILYVGRLEPRKGTLVFAEAIPKIARLFPDAIFVFLGADRKSPGGASQKEELQHIFKKSNLGERVYFYGHASPSVFLEFYQKASLFVMPSLFENCPYTLLEAMSCACPSIASHVGGIPEIIEDGRNGILFSTGSASELADCAVSLLNNALLSYNLGTQARKTILEKYSLPVSTLATENFYERVLSKD